MVVGAVLSNAYLAAMSRHKVKAEPPAADTPPESPKSKRVKVEPRVDDAAPYVLCRGVSTITAGLVCFREVEG